jgi:phosphohistidine phosphatase
MAETTDDVDTAAVVGHEPHLSHFVCWLLTGRNGQFVELKKGGACLLELEQERAAAKAKLLWFLTPKQLRKLTR